jgi:hypothetical protein
MGLLPTNWSANTFIRIRRVPEHGEKYLFLITAAASVRTKQVKA